MWVCSEDHLADCLTKESAFWENVHGALSGKVNYWTKKNVVIVLAFGIYSIKADKLQKKDRWQDTWGLPQLW